MQFRARRMDMVVHVDANGLGYYLRNARINPIGRRIQPCRPEQHGAARAHRYRQEFSSRKTRIIISQHTAHCRPPLDSTSILTYITLARVVPRGIVTRSHRGQYPGLVGNDDAGPGRGTLRSVMDASPIASMPI